jgi:hypothetical protein
MGGNPSKTSKTRRRWGPSNRIAIIVPYFNPAQYARRDQLYMECLERLLQTALRLESKGNDCGLHIVAVALAYGSAPGILDRCFVDHADVERHVTRVELRLPEKDIMWSKEQLINIGISRLPKGEKFVGWIDGDVEFGSYQDQDAWVASAVATLRKSGRAFGQLWETAEFLGSDGKVVQTFTSFCAQHNRGKKYEQVSNKDPNYWHPGFAWCATMSALRAMGPFPGNPLLDRTLGSADLHMAMALLGRVVETIPPDMSTAYKQFVLDWEKRARTKPFNIVAVPGKLLA